MAKWVTRWRLRVSATPVLPGIWRLKGGGFVASAQVRDPLDSPAPDHRPKYQTVFAVMRDAVTAKQAHDWLIIECRRVRDTVFDVWPEIPTWKDFAVSVIERKVAAGDIRSASTLHRLKGGLARIIETAAWASSPMNAISHDEIRRWREALPTLSWKAEKRFPDGKTTIIRSGHRYSPFTLNVLLATAASIWKVAVVRFALPTNPMRGVEHFVAEATYSAEQPNALDPRSELPEFLERLRKRYPRWYAFTLLGFVLGLKPSLLRPLRRRGPHADIDLARKRIYIRRSHTRGEQVLDAAKSGGKRELLLPDELIDVLRDHIKKIDASPMGPKSDLLFPSAFTGKMLSTGCLTTSWSAIAKEMGLTKRVTPRAMSRTFQQIANDAKTNALAAMVVGWHKSRGARPAYATKHDDDDVSAALVRLICVGTASGAEKS